MSDRFDAPADLVRKWEGQVFLSIRSAVATKNHTSVYKFTVIYFGLAM